MAKLYRHYKGNLYEYIGECLHSETLEEMVIYKALYGEGKTWVRPKEWQIPKNWLSFPKSRYDQL